MNERKSSGAKPVSSVERALSATSAQSAFMHALMGLQPPLLGTPEHRGMVQGKDMMMMLALSGLRAEQQHGDLKHLTPDDMVAIATVLGRADLAASLHLGVDARGNPLPKMRG